MPRFQPGIRFCEKLTESPFVAAGVEFCFFVVAAFVVVVSAFFVVVVVTFVVAGATVVATVVAVVATVVSALVVTVVVSAFVVAAVVSAFVAAVVVVCAVVAAVVALAVVVVAELFSDDVSALLEQAEIPVMTIIPLRIAASILFFIDTFLSSAVK